ncbi:MAG: alkyl sulfatase dimerization domain-containing protein [Eubacteriales bacterium]|nr:alkyl sulfatase dimerization domain-containing protein [Eubacteriales bacterium]
MKKKVVISMLAFLFAASAVGGRCDLARAEEASSQEETESEQEESGQEETESSEEESGQEETESTQEESGASSDEGESEPLNGEIKDATEYTAEINAAVYELLDFSDEQEREFAEKGFIAAPDSLEIKTEDGTTVWSQDVYRFVEDEDSPDSANPSLWRNTQLNALYGLFEVTDGIYQVRGYDVANVTFVRSDNGWIIFDCTTSVETAEAALELFKENIDKEAHIAAVVISHAHIDHYGGVGGLIKEEDLADATLPLEEQIASGKTLLIVPEGFEKAAMEENVFAGNAMKRRSNYQYGSLLQKGENGSLSVGIGLTPSNGTTSYLSPTFEVTEDVFEVTVDGVDMVFQLTPDTESPAEMNTYLPGYKALWMAENCTGTMHNLYTLRGAEIRDGNAWAQYIMEAKALFGDKTEVVFQSHNWPHWGSDVIDQYLLDTASVYKYITSQTLQYLNEGYTSTEIANMISLPEELEKVWYTRQYYGTLKHNAKAVYQKYMGWYDANPVHLDELEPSEYAQKLVEYLGDTDKVLEMAREDFDKGEYQWVAEITNTLVYAQPDNQDARYLCADALEQLGYQAESGAWRNAYLTAAYELRHGTEDYPQTTAGGTGATALGMSTETMIDYLGICMDAKKMEDENLVINLEVTDEGEKYLLEINHGVLLYSKEEWSDEPDAVIKTKRAGILGIARNNQQLMDASIESVSGDVDILAVLTGSLAEFPPYFNIIEP